MIGHNSDPELQRIASELNKELAADVDSIFRKGRLFLDCKKTLGHGQFLRLFSNHKEPLAEPVTCSPQWARKFMSIAENETLANGNSRFVLPRDVNLLYELSRIDGPGLKIALEKGLISPHMTKKDIAAIRISIGIDDEKPPRDARDASSNFLIFTRRKASKILDELSKDECRGFLFQLECMAKELQWEIDLTTEATNETAH